MQFTQLATQDDENMMREALQSSAADVNQLFHKRGKQFMGIDSMGFLQILQSSAVDANHLVHKKR
ncbi:unnamed protein product [Sphagnum balticum]